jgi:hypothetical protein
MDRVEYLEKLVLFCLAFFQLKNNLSLENAELVVVSIGQDHSMLTGESEIWRYAGLSSQR